MKYNQVVNISLNYLNLCKCSVCFASGSTSSVLIRFDPFFLIQFNGKIIHGQNSAITKIVPIDGAELN